MRCSKGILKALIFKTNLSANWKASYLELTISHSLQTITILLEHRCRNTSITNILITGFLMWGVIANTIWIVNKLIYVNILITKRILGAFCILLNRKKTQTEFRRHFIAAWKISQGNMKTGIVTSELYLNFIIQSI